MFELEQLRGDHAARILAFELANRGYFAASISDRGDDYFEHFFERHEALLAEQEAGLGAYFVLVDEDGSVVGRFNLYLVEHGVWTLGYRVAQQVSGHGVATATVGDLCSLAAVKHGVRIVRAATAHANVASQRVLLKAGFTEVGPAEPSDLGGKHGTWYHLDVSQRPDEA